MRRTSSSGASTCSTPTTARSPRRPCSAPSSFRRRRRQDRPDPGPDPDRREVVQRRRLEGPLHPQRRPDQQRPARQGQRVRVGQPRDERVAQLVHLLRLPGGAGEAQGQAVRLRDRAVLQRQDHGQAPRRHLQPAQVDQGPGRGLQGPDRPRRLERAAHPVRRLPGRSGPAAGVLRRDQQELPGRQARLDRPAGDARLPGRPQPSGLGSELRQGEARLAEVPEQLPDELRC